MRRVGILTAGGDTPALNATIFGAVEKANAAGVEMFGIIDGFGGLLRPDVPHVWLNPNSAAIPELNPATGGSILGASRTYIDADHPEQLRDVTQRLNRLGIEGLICIGGDGTLNGMQPLANLLPSVLAPKTIDNDLGLNYPGEPLDAPESSRATIQLADIVNFATPGYATAVFVVAQEMQRIRTTAESHRRIAIVEVMGRETGHIALGSAYGQPDFILIPEVPLNLAELAGKIRETYQQRQHCVIAIGEGVVDASGARLGAIHSQSKDPAGNVIFHGAADALATELACRLGDKLFQSISHLDSAKSAIFTRKVGHTQRGGRPIHFDRMYGERLGGKAFELLHGGQTDVLATLQWSAPQGFQLDCLPACELQDRAGQIHPRLVHRSLFDATRWQPSALGVEYLRAIFTNAISREDVDVLRRSLFAADNLLTSYHSTTVEMSKRIQHLD